MPSSERSTPPCTAPEISRDIPDVISHTEHPFCEPSPPLFLLSKLVRHSGFKVVVTAKARMKFGFGYDIFKETKIRRFWAGQPTRVAAVAAQRLYRT